MECLVCRQDVEPLHEYTDITGDWCQVVISCPECGATYVGDIQIDHFSLDSDPDEHEIKE